ncbi:MAG: phosphate regulon sensor histidine kinase PhoR [Gammaproteobacteria bacterium]|nr:phosphate regulon sensor histidine kinase PhoR [Gammaproteobacteria bacterium]
MGNSNDEQLQRQRKRFLHREKAVSKQLKEFETATSSLPIGIVMLGREQRVQWFNPIAANYFKFRGNKLNETTLEKLLVQHQLKHILPQLQEGKSVIISAPGDQATALQVKLVELSKKRWLLILDDVTQEQLLQQMRQDFIANVSHELRTPLTVIAGYLELLSESGIVIAPSHRTLWDNAFNQLHEHTWRMQRIISDLLYLSSIEHEKSSDSEEDWIDIEVMLHSIRGSALMIDAQKDLTIKIDCQRGLALLGDDQAIYSAINNLVINAVKYTPSGGTIHLVWRDVAVGCQHCPDFCQKSRAKKGAILAVSDNGVGIDAQHLPRLTERFYRVDKAHSRQTGGTGLGLAIVKHIFKRHNTQLEVSSAVGRGSCFFAVFPPNRVELKSLK